MKQKDVISNAQAMVARASFVRLILDGELVRKVTRASLHYV